MARTEDGCVCLVVTIATNVSVDISVIVGDATTEGSSAVISTGGTLRVCVVRFDFATDFSLAETSGGVMPPGHNPVVSPILYPK